MLGFSSIAQTAVAEVPSPNFIIVTGVSATGEVGVLFYAITSGSAFIIFF
jgi:hypothetical protein